MYLNFFFHNINNNKIKTLNFEILCLCDQMKSKINCSDCNQRKRKIRDQIEMKLDSGIDKCMTSIIGWMKNILKSEQKRQDFLSNDISALECTNACKKV